MKFLVDNQLPVALSQWLISRGLDCLHVADVGLAEAPDQEIWTFACVSGRVVVSKDEDFLFRASREAEGAGLIWVRLGNCRTKALLSEFERLWPRIEASLREGERVIEVR